MTRARSPSASAFRITCSTTRAASRTAVIDRFAESYVAGETPVPCVECNQSIKFRDLLETARDLGASVLATGHYVASRALPGGAPRALSRPRGRARPELFPVRHHACAARLPTLPARRRTKAETRELARRFGLAGRRQARQPGHLLRAERTLCRRDRAAAAGRRRAGRDRRPRWARRSAAIDGIMHFTVGQRRGLGIAAGDAALRDPARRSCPVASSSARAKRCARAASGCAR